MEAITHTTTIEPHFCIRCGVAFGLAVSFRELRQRDGRSFYCPNGHTMVYRETEADRQRKRAERAERATSEQQARARRAESDAEYQRTQAERVRRSRAAIKGQLTKTKNRISAGVCPCCNRTFQNLARHMDGQHTDYAERNDKGATT